MTEKYQPVCLEQRDSCYVLKPHSRIVELIADKPSLIDLRKKGGYLAYHCHSSRFKYGKFIFLITTEEQYKAWTRKEKRKIRDAFNAEADSSIGIISDKGMDHLINTLCKKDYGPCVSMEIKKYGLKARLFSTMEIFPRFNIP